MEEMAEVPMKRLHTALFFPYIVGLEKFFEHFHCELRLFFFCTKSLHHCPVTGSHATKGRSLNPFSTEPSISGKVGQRSY